MAMTKATATYNFSGCSVLVTGGTSGIGLGIATAFADAGATVVITGTRSDAADYKGTDLSRFEYQTLQATNRHEIDALGASFNKLDVLVNNAGANLLGEPGGEWAAEHFEKSVNINLFSGFHLANACIDALKASSLPGGASIINMGSLTSFFGNVLTPAYGASKAANVQLSMTQAQQWAADNVRVNAVAPGLILTRMTEPMQSFDEMMEPIMARTPLRRWGTPEDIAGAALFLCSDQASWITGQTLVIDGGYSTVG